MAAPATGQKPTRDRILAAALTAFADRGVEATSLDSLAAEIGVRKQTILYWFPSKEVLLLGVVDHAVAELGARLSSAALAARPARGRRATDRLPTLEDRLIAVVDATFRLGTTHPELLAVVREVARVGPPASTHLAAAVDPLVDAAASALAADADRARIRRVLLAAGARVVGMATEAEVRQDLGLAPDRAWLRARRRTLIAALTDDLGGGPVASRPRAGPAEDADMMKQVEEIAGGPVLGGAKVMAPNEGDSPLRPRELGYLTATQDRLLILTFKHGLIHPTATGIRAEAPLSIVADIEVGKGLLNPVTVRFTGGQIWFVISDKTNLGKVRALVQAVLGARPN